MSTWTMINTQHVVHEHLFFPKNHPCLVYLKQCILLKRSSTHPRIVGKFFRFVPWGISRPLGFFFTPWGLECKVGRFFLGRFHPWKFNGLPLKNDGKGRRSFPFWVSVTFQGRAVKLRGCIFFLGDLVFVSYPGWLIKNRLVPIVVPVPNCGE